MKKKISLLISILIIMTSMTVFASATTENAEYTYEIDNTEYTVEFTDSNLSAEKQKAIAAKLVGAEYSEAVPANILCDIFGHDFVTSQVKVVTHKVRTTAPRCKEETFSVNACEDCDYSEQTLIGTNYIDCCAE